jgi:hypothetical protein
MVDGMKENLKRTKIISLRGESLQKTQKNDGFNSVFNEPFAGSLWRYTADRQQKELITS